jgi:hypothetical protein
MRSACLQLAPTENYPKEQNIKFQSLVTGKTSLYKALGISVKVKYIALQIIKTDGYL